VTIPTHDWFVIVMYAMFWPVRINGCVRRGRQPLLRGHEWFFDVRVPEGFYGGPGRRLLRQYWLRMMIPFAVDVPWAIWIFASGRLFQLNILILVVAAMIHVNHLWSKRLAERQAQPYAVPESTRPAARVALSLTPRRLRDYTSPTFEWTLAAVAFASVAWLTGYYLTSASHPSARVVFAMPLVTLYFQAGFLIVKRAVLGWPAPVPQDQAEAFMTAAEERRRYYVKFWDWSRAASVVSMLVWPLVIIAPEPVANRLVTGWLALCVVLGIVATVLVEIKRKQIETLASRTRPVPLPDLLGLDGASWPVCYEPSAPALMLRSANGYSLNLGNSIALYTAAYLVGFALLIIVLTHMTP
jgi:hypothetical protein